MTSSIQYLIVYLLKENADFLVSGEVGIVLIYTTKTSKFTVG